MDTKKKNLTRKTFMLWGAGIFASISIFKFVFPNKNKKNNTVKMLTQDGTLVEVDPAVLKAPKRKISNEELKNWVKK